MRSLQEAQEALVEFDRRYWRHERGAESIVHTYLHLTEALFRKFVKEAEPLNQEVILRHWIAEIVPRLIEHAMRLANNCDISLDERVNVLFAKPKQSSPILGIPESWYEIYVEMVMSQSNDQWTAFKDYVRSLGEALHPLALICERLSRGEDFDQEKCTRVASIITSLISHVFLFLLLTEGKIDEEVMRERLITIFEQRLARLSEYFEYAS